MDNKAQFISEDENAGYATPRQDLIASAILIVLSLWVMIESVALANPGTIATAPGLLPFIVAASLMGMALGLGWLAVQRFKSGEKTVSTDSPDELRRAAMLVAIIIVYLLGLETITFDYTASVAGVRLGYGVFEVLTTIMLTLVLWLFWKRPVLPCLAVAAVWSTLLAAAFRYVFVVPLPGTL